MLVKELFEKYCKKYDEGQYICRGRIVKLVPATEEKLDSFKALCREYNVEQHIMDELVEYYKQANKFFTHLCDDESLFEWWEDDEQKAIWLGNVDDDSFVYDDHLHKYAIGVACCNEFGEYDTLMEMLEAYLKEGYENGWNG